jgi:hypothetical protein
MNFEKYKPKSYLLKVLDNFSENEELLIDNLFNILTTSNYFKIGSCEPLFLDINNCIVYYSIDIKSDLFIKYAYQESIVKRLLKSPRLAAIYSLLIANQKLPSKVHDKVAEFVVKQMISVKNIKESYKNFKQKDLYFLAKHSFEDLENNAPEIYLYKYNLNEKTK